MSERAEGPAAGPDGAASSEYEVGYKKPPLHSRFQAGQSGNPKGRPAGSKTVKALIERELGSTIAIRENGRRVELTKREVMVKQLVNKAIDGDHRAQQTLLKFEQEQTVPGCSRHDHAIPADAPLEADDRAILDAFAAMLKGEHAAARQGPDGNDQADDDHGTGTGDVA